MIGIFAFLLAKRGKPDEFSSSVCDAFHSPCTAFSRPMRFGTSRSQHHSPSLELFLTNRQCKATPPGLSARQGKLGDSYVPLVIVSRSRVLGCSYLSDQWPLWNCRLRKLQSVLHGWRAFSDSIQQNLLQPRGPGKSDVGHLPLLTIHLTSPFFARTKGKWQVLCAALSLETYLMDRQCNATLLQCRETGKSYMQLLQQSIEPTFQTSYTCSIIDLCRLCSFLTFSLFPSLQHTKETQQVLCAALSKLCLFATYCS
jgi:hypothetical protein